MNLDAQRYELVGWGPTDPVLEPVPPATHPCLFTQLSQSARLPLNFAAPAKLYTIPHSDLSLQDSALVTPHQAPGEVSAS